MSKSTVLSSVGNAALKHEKPYPDYPLFPHATGCWAKKIRGKLVYFGRVSDDPTGVSALNLWKSYQADLLAGRAPRIAKVTPPPKTPAGVKPSQGFPLFPHASGRWSKKVRGKFAYFGKVTGRS